MASWYLVTDKYRHIDIITIYEILLISFVKIHEKNTRVENDPILNEEQFNIRSKRLLCYKNIRFHLSAF